MTLIHFITRMAAAVVLISEYKYILNQKISLAEENTVFFFSKLSSMMLSVISDIKQVHVTQIKLILLAVLMLTKVYFKSC